MFDKIVFDFGVFDWFSQPIPTGSPNLTSRKNYNGYLAFVQQFIRHRLDNSTPWAHPNGFLL